MAKIDITVCTSLCGKGLEREYLLLKEFLTAHDCYLMGVHYTAYANSNLVRSDFVICLEVIMPNVLSLATQRFLLPNCEWWNPINDRFLPMFTRILGKTEDCVRVWKNKLSGDRPERVSYLGFEARDLYDPTVPRENRFLHVAGESEFKGTASVIEAWCSQNWQLAPPPLTVVTRQKKFLDMCVGSPSVPGITVYDHVSDEELKRLMNSHRFHIIPCAYEGFGHIIHEAIGCGALVVTTGAPPMNEFPGIQADWTCPVSTTDVRALATMQRVTRDGVIFGCCKAIARMGFTDELEQRSQAARSAFLSERDLFRNRILGLLGVS